MLPDGAPVGDRGLPPPPLRVACVHLPQGVTPGPVHTVLAGPGHLRPVGKQLFAEIERDVVAPPPERVNE
jgi:hypothetical protein